MNTLNFRDWFVIVVSTGLWLAATWFLFTHPGEANFATWATVSGSMLGAYHWMVIRDQKIRDSCEYDHQDPAADSQIPGWRGA